MRPAWRTGIGTLRDPGRLSTLSADRGEPRHDQYSQGASALVPGAAVGPPGRIRARGPEPSPADPSYRSSIAPARTSARAAPPRRSSGPSAPRVWLHLRPGQKGTKQRVAQYGDRLIGVRYRYDAQRKKRFKTVELLVAGRDWEPPPPRFAHDHIVALRVTFADVAVRDRVKRAGGTWTPDRRVWQVRYDRVIALGLTRLIVNDSASNSGCSEP